MVSLLIPVGRRLRATAGAKALTVIATSGVLATTAASAPAEIAPAVAAPVTAGQPSEAAVANPDVVDRIARALASMPPPVGMGPGGAGSGSAASGAASGAGAGHSSAAGATTLYLSSPGSAPSGQSSSPGAAGSPGSFAAPGMPARALAAYRAAAATLARTDPGCHLSWTLLAAIGTVESNNGQFGGAVIGGDGVVRPAIIGIRLDGSTPGTGVVRDTDHGVDDGDPVYDHAVGPMQFLPGTWMAYGVSATPGRAPNPENVNDAALTAGTYLCATGLDLSGPQARAAVLAYNASDSYANTVLALARAYANAPLSQVARVAAGAASSTGGTSVVAGSSGRARSAGSTTRSASESIPGSSGSSQKPAPKPISTPIPKPTPTPKPASSPTPSSSPTDADHVADAEQLADTEHHRHRARRRRPAPPP